MTEIEEIKAQLKVLQSKLSFLEELERTKTPCEEAFKRIYNVYPSSSEKSAFWTDDDEDTWIVFQNGYSAAQKDYKVGEYQPTPQSPEQVADGLKEAFREAVKQGVVSSVDNPKDDFIDKMVAELKGETLYDICMTWWERVFGNTDDTETCIDDLVDNIDYWLPKEQSAAGSQNAYVECSVEGFNDCLNKIKRNLR